MFYGAYFSTCVTVFFLHVCIFDFGSLTHSSLTQLIAAGLTHAALHSLLWSPGWSAFHQAAHVWRSENPCNANGSDRKGNRRVFSLIVIQTFREEIKS